MAEEQAVLTRYCKECHKRHPLNHEHFQGSEDSDPTTKTILGSDSPSGLGETIRQRLSLGKGKKGEGKKTATEQKLSAEEQERRRVSLRAMGRRFARVPFTCASLATSNPLWRSELRDEEINELGEEWAQFAEAWGIQTVGKVAATMALGIAYAEIGGSVYARVQLKTKEAEGDIA